MWNTVLTLAAVLACVFLFIWALGDDEFWGDDD
jgi:hypothetical protein